MTPDAESAKSRIAENRLENEDGFGRRHSTYSSALIRFPKQLDSGNHILPNEATLHRGFAMPGDGRDACIMHEHPIRRDAVDVLAVDLKIVSVHGCFLPFYALPRDVARERRTLLALALPSANGPDQWLATLDFPSGPILSRVRCIA
jgi:hypothetical protein